MYVKLTPISQIKFHPKNPRIQLSEKDLEFQQIDKSLEKFGNLQPVVINIPTGYLLSGHQRVVVSKARGVKEIEALFVELDPNLEVEAMVAINKITGRWDFPKLANILQDFGQLPGFDLKSIGFTAPDLSNILDNYLSSKEDSFNFNAAIESIDVSITKKGDLVELGPHRILCGDASNCDDVKLLMADHTADLIVMDPPYLAHYIPGNRPGKKRKKTFGKIIQNDSMSQEDYDVWFGKVLINAKSTIVSGTSIYIWHGFRQFCMMGQKLTESGFHLSNVITWVKPSPCISYSDYNFESEFCLYAWLEGEKPHRWFGSTKESNVWRVNRENQASIIHQNQKPLELIKRSIRNSSLRGEIILDLFLGSGSTLLAAESLARRCFGTEIVPRYVDGIVRRYIAFVGINNVSAEIREKYCKEVRS